MRRPNASTLAITAGFVLAMAYIAWLLAPRYGITSPAAVDDWNGASRPNASLIDLLRPFVETPHQRFRPGYDLFDYIEWHTFGAPDMTSLNVWNVFRVGLLAAAVGLVPALVARATRPALSPLTLGVLAALAPILLVTGVVAVDLARLAPQEPMLVGATVCGGALVLLGLDRLMAGARLRRVLVPAIPGWLLFALGVFHKEATVAFLVTVPFVFMFLARRWRELGIVRSWREPLRDWRFLAFGAALLIPLLWHAYRTASIGGEGVNLYGGGAPSGISGWATRLKDAFDAQWNALAYTVGTIWRGLAVGVPFLAVAVWADRRRVPWLAIGFALAGWLMLIIQGLPGVITTRYFLPPMAMFLLAATLLLAEGRAWLRWVAIAGVLIVVLSSARTERYGVEVWSDDQKSTSNFVAYTAGLAEHGCKLETWGQDVEHADALPRLVGLQTHQVSGVCPVRTGAIVATQWSATTAPGAKYEGPWANCLSKWTKIYSSGLWVAMRCDRLRPNVEKDLRTYRLVPGVGPGPHGACIAARGILDESCDRARLDRNNPWP